MESPGTVIKHSRIIFFVFSLATAMAIGASVGAWFGFNTARGSLSFRGEVGSAEWFSGQILAERMMGDPTAYRSALLKYLAALQSRRSGDGVLLNDHVVVVDTVLTEARLAILAQSQGNESESKLYFARGLEHCNSAWKTGCTVERLREIVARLDGKSSSPPH